MTEMNFFIGSLAVITALAGAAMIRQVWLEVEWDRQKTIICLTYLAAVIVFSLVHISTRLGFFNHIALMARIGRSLCLLGTVFFAYQAKMKWADPRERVRLLMACALTIFLAIGPMMSKLFPRLTLAVYLVWSLLLFFSNRIERWLTRRIEKKRCT